MTPETFERPQQILLLSAKDEASLYGLAAKYVEFLRENTGVRLSDICYTSAVGRTHFNWRLAISARSIEELLLRLESYLEGDSQAIGVEAKKPNVKMKKGKTAFLFSGQGSQYAGMARQLFTTQPVFRKTFLRCEEILSQYLEKPISKVLCEPAEEQTLLKQISYTQSILCSMQYSCFELWRTWGVTPDALMGHSMGEYMAAAAAGVMSLEDALRLVAKRIELVNTVRVPGEMGAVNADEKTVKELLVGFEDKVSIAALNSPSNTVVSGERHAVIAFLDKVKTKNIKVKLLAIGWASHSPLLDEILDRFGQAAEQAAFHAPAIQLISNLTGQPVDDGDIDANYWRRHLRNTVKFSQGMGFLLAGGYRCFVEMGPGTTLLSMGQLTLDVGTTDTIWLPSLTTERADWDQLLETVAKLYVDGFDLDWKGFEKDYPRRSRIELPTYAFERKNFWPEGEIFGASNRVSEVGSQDRPLRAQRTDIVDKLRNATGTERKELMSGYLAAEVKKILHYAPEYEVDPNTELSKIGADSLAMMELRNSIERDFMGLLSNLPRSLVFTYPTVNLLGGHLLSTAFSTTQHGSAKVEGEGVGMGAGMGVGDPVEGQMLDKWIRNARKSAEARARLICFHYAGGAAQIFDELARTAPAWLEVVAVQLPGRWERINEEPLTDIRNLRPGLARALEKWTTKPYAVLGYSMGAILSFDWAQKSDQNPSDPSRSDRNSQPLCFFPTSCGSPQDMLSKPRFPVDEDNLVLLDNFQKIIGPMPKQLLETADLRDIWVPLLRGDLKLLNSYAKIEDTVFDFPIHILASREDHSINERSINGWKNFSRAEGSTDFFVGGHFFLAGAEKARAFDVIFHKIESALDMPKAASRVVPAVVNTAKSA